MKTEENNKLFLVKFGKPNVGSGMFSGSSSTGPLFVIAESYDEARWKAIEYIEKHATEGISVIDSDGSLKKSDEMNVRSVELATDIIVS